MNFEFHHDDKPSAPLVAWNIFSLVGAAGCVSTHTLNKCYYLNQDRYKPPLSHIRFEAHDSAYTCVRNYEASDVSYPFIYNGEGSPQQYRIPYPKIIVWRR